MKDNLNQFNQKVRQLYFVLLAFGAVILLASIRWQAIEASKLSKIGEQRTSTAYLESVVRGAIYAADGSTIAYSEPRFDLFVWLQDLQYFEKLDIQTREEFVKKIAPIIDTTPEVFGEKLKNFETNGQLWIKVASSLSDAQWARLNTLTTDKFKDFPLRGFHFENTSKRVYPEGRLASHVIGLVNLVNESPKGVSGLEGNWNELLKPTKGVLIQESNAKGEAVATALTASVEPKNGSNLYTSINKKLQKAVEQKIKEGVEKYKALSGSVVIMDPKTNQIMAMANYPDYDPNLREEKEAKVYENIAITSPYEMGSIGKALTIAAAEDLGRVDADKVILPQGHQGSEQISDYYTIKTWDGIPQGPMPLKDCFANSDNICLYHVAKEYLSKEEMHDYLERFGVGNSTGIDLAGESISFLREAIDWTEEDVAATSYGHGYSVNVLQAASAISAIANHGVRMKPYIVSKVVEGDGTVNEYKPQVVDTVIKSSTAEQVTDMMVYNYAKAIAPGEWWYEDLRNYRIAIKSGTALIADSTGYQDEINASFVGFDASPERTFIMLVKLEKPEEGQKLSFYNVRPLWLDTFAAVKDIIGVPRL